MLAKVLSGKGTDARNLSTCTRPANTYTTGATRIDYNFRYYESLVKNAVDANQVVQYSVTPEYFDDKVTVPMSWTFNATVWYQDGTSETLINGQQVWNTFGDAKGNFGLQVDGDGYTTPR